MCGIAGYVFAHPFDGSNLIASMLEAIARRGPDGRGAFQDERAAIGMTRLAVIDLKTG